MSPNNDTGRVTDERNKGADMITGLFFVLAGILIALYPQILIMMISGVLVMFGLGVMITSWQFRRFHKQSSSRFMNWIIRY